jgi:hypothetical protein
MRASIVVVIAMALCLWGESAVPARATIGASHAALGALAWPERVGLEQAMAAIDPGTMPGTIDGAPTLAGARFDRSGAHLAIGGALRAAAMGRTSMRALDTSTPTIVGREVETDHGAGVTEWWRSIASGLEHGLTITSRPDGDGALRIELALSALTARGEDPIDLLDASGILAATYAHLVVLDAEGVVVPAHMAANGASIAITIDDARAVYPIVVDPIIASQEAELTASDATTGSDFGVSVALSGDGSRALVGADSRLTNQGGAYVYARSGTQWTQEAILTTPDGLNTRFGDAVAISDDGMHAFVGEPGRLGNVGGVQVFLRSSTTWTRETVLVASDGVTNDSLGAAVACSADGSRVVAGASGRASRTGVAVVFARTTSWAQEAELSAADAATNRYFGNAIAMSGVADRVVVGSPNNQSAYVFVRSGTAWSQEAEVTSGANDTFGQAVAISGDSTHIMVGATAHGASGAAFIYAQPPSWPQEAIIVPADGGPNFGCSVALSVDASRAVVGASQHASYTGAAYAFERSGVTWTQAAEPVASDGVANDQFGGAIAISSDGGRAIAGARGQLTGTGAAYVFELRSGAIGTACTSTAMCLSGNCVDGVCCDTACGGGAASHACSSCIAARTGGVDGTCAALTAAIAPTVTCRPIASGTACDVAEICSAASTACPTDAFLPSTTICHTGANCFASQTCTGASADCPTAAAAATATCRPSAGACDVAEICDGNATTCPPDSHQPNGAVCRSVMGICDQQEVCDGTNAQCPTDAFLGASTTCRVSAGPCDVPEVCNGAMAACPIDAFMPTGTVCDSVVSGVCDQPDVCSGSSAACAPMYISGVVCRAANGGCDIAESCTGGGPSCPPDTVESAGTVCRMSTDPACDPAEHCDGTSTACPSDTNTCHVMADAGVVTDAGSTADAGSNDAGRDASASDAMAGNDASSAPPPAAGGCGCRASGHGDAWWLALIAIVIARRRRAALRPRG